MEDFDDVEEEREFTWRPQPGPQTAFVHCPIPEIFFGGARGGGKTDAAIGKMMIRCLQFGKGERGIFFRRTYKQLEEVMLRAHDLFPVHNAKWREKDLSWTFPNGAWIKFAYLERDIDAQNHQGKSYCVGVGTPILMGDGSSKPIESIRPGELVSTLEGPRRVSSVVPPYRARSVRVSVYSEKDGAFLGEQLQPLSHPVLTSVSESSSRSSPKHQTSSRHTLDRTPWRSVLPHPYLDRARRGSGVFSEDGRSDCRAFEHDNLKPGQLLVSNARVALALPRPPSEVTESRPIECRVSCRCCKPCPGIRHQCPKSSTSCIPPLFGRLRRALGRALSTLYDRIRIHASCVLLDLQRAVGFRGHCLAGFHSCDGQLPRQSRFAPSDAPSRAGVGAPYPLYRTLDETGNTPLCSGPQCGEYIHPYTGELRRSSFPVESGRATIVYVGEAWVCDLSVEDVNHYIGASTGLVNLNTCICIEEAGTFPSWEPIAKLKATLRSAKGIPTQLLLTGNPGGPGANWVRARYIDPAPVGWKPIKEVQHRLLPNGEMGTYETERIYIPSRVTDNQILMQKDPTYIARLLESGSEQLVKAWLEGDFYVVDGAFFDNYDMKKHVMKATDLPQHWTKYRAMDWGSYRPFAVYWIAVASEDWHHPVSGHLVPKDALVVYREWYGIAKKPDGSIQPNKGLKLYAEEVGKGILQREKGERVDFGVIDPSAYASDGGPSIAERIARGTNGKIMLRRADNKRLGPDGALGGWDQVRGRLGGQEHPRSGTENVPMLFFFDNCEHLLRTLPMMQHDPDRPEDIDTTAEDHAVDALRYGCMARPYSRPTPGEEKRMTTISDVRFEELWHNDFGQLV